MCGIAGLAGPPGRGEALERRCRAMEAALAHRGPDAGGVWTDASAGIGFAHRRLSIQDLSEAGAQPMHSASGRLVLCYNGECYNAPELREELAAAGHRFRGHSDTEVILAGFERWGLEATLPRMVGMFALALWDRERRELALVRDRLGIKPLYWTQREGTLVFASELKAMMAALDARPAISQTGLGCYLRYGHLLAPLTIYEGVHQLPPGTVLRLAAGGEPRAEPFWTLAGAMSGAAARVSDPAEGRALIEAELGRAVRQRLIADVPVGVFLSGGIDSALIAAVTAEQAEGPVDSYSIGMASAGYDESAQAREVAARIGTRHHELAVGEDDCLEAIPRLAGVWDEPFADSSQIPTLVLSRLARRHVTVALSGDGGDELFAGYNRHRWHQALAAGVGLRARLLGQGARAAGALPPGWLDRLGGLAGRGGLERRVGKLAAMAEAAGPGEAHRAALTRWTGLGPPEPEPHPAYAIAAGLPGLSAAERMQVLDLLTYLPDDILTKVDRASMAHGLEVRVPFLDHRVVAAAFRLAPTLKLRGRTTKWMLRQMLYARLPRALVDRPKRGFAIPIERWLAGRLRPWAEGLIGDTEWSALGIKAAPVRASWARLLAGDAGEADRVWTMLMLAAWLEARPR